MLYMCFFFFLKGLFDCPCTLERLGRQWWEYSNDDNPDEPNSVTICFALSPAAKSRLERLRGNTLNRVFRIIIIFDINDLI